MKLNVSPMLVLKPLMPFHVLPRVNSKSLHYIRNNCGTPVDVYIKTIAPENMQVQRALSTDFPHA